MIESYPLHWPLGYKTTVEAARKASPFKQSADKAQIFLRKELEKLEAVKVVVSTNVPLGRQYKSVSNNFFKIVIQ